MPTHIYVYGYGGWEQWLESHVKTFVIFAVADQKKTQLAWYTYATNSLTQLHQLEYDDVAIARRQLRRNVKWASPALGQPTLDVYDFNFRIGDLAPKLGAPGNG